MDRNSMIYIDGGSNTFGDELVDQQQAWPYVIGRTLQKSVLNKAMRGKSGQHIMFDLVNFCSTQKPDLVVIGWVGIHRKMFVSREQNLVVDISPAGQNSVFHNNKEFKNFQKLLYTCWSNYLYDAWQFLHNIVLVQNFLKANNIPYLMFNDVDQADVLKLLTITSQDVKIKESLLDAFPNINDQDIMNIEKTINSVYASIDHENFYDFSWHIRKIVSYISHPSEENHQTIADFLLPLVKRSL